MAWIELHQSVWTHRKSIMLAAMLDMHRVHAAAHVIHFWTWALDNAPDGRLPKIAKVVAAGADWPGDPETFTGALIQAGWLDEVDNHLEIHDWEEYAGKLMQRREANRERVRKHRSQSGNGVVTVTKRLRNGATVPNRTLPETTDANASGAVAPSRESPEGQKEGVAESSESESRGRAATPSPAVEANGDRESPFTTLAEWREGLAQEFAKPAGRNPTAFVARAHIAFHGLHLDDAAVSKLCGRIGRMVSVTRRWNPQGDYQAILEASHEACSKAAGQPLDYMQKALEGRAARLLANGGKAPGQPSNDPDKFKAMAAKFNRRPE